MLRLGFIGAGTAGTALSVKLSQRGYLVVAVASRTFDSAQRLAGKVPGCQAYEMPQQVAEAAELVFITTPDDAIAGVVAKLRWGAGKTVVHCSGVASLDILEPARQAGAQVGGFHPLQTFASAQQAIQNLPGSAFGIEAEGEVLDRLAEMAQALDGDWVQLQEGDKVLYHAAAVFACNYWITLIRVATELWGHFGADSAKAVKALVPLLRGTLLNVESVGLPNCLSGPIARGDLGTIEKHMAALKKDAPEFLTLYRELGLHTIPVALGKGRVDDAGVEAMSKMLTTGA
ncbi:MAG: DUF2520 domain-containing protein [Dehalococcoidia bacterium]|nr:DUF2520 domain-containing protein [Dehalococcoidia bacterium]